ncbi:hypothetical protein DL93DRAFT_761029 [Clavulina sp. PMI_390]|nr:hypothetical protein DL93DRAFT_761029 [Clavulina sp. PMI_390]
MRRRLEPTPLGLRSSSTNKLLSFVPSSSTAPTVVSSCLPLLQTMPLDTTHRKSIQSIVSSQLGSVFIARIGTSDVQRAGTRQRRTSRAFRSTHRVGWIREPFGLH